MSSKITVRDFMLDRTGRAFRSVVDDDRIDFEGWIDFFNDATRQRRMIDAEISGSPALAGVTVELEKHPAFAGFLTDGDQRTAFRRRQAIGVIVRLVMEGLAWRKAMGSGRMTGISLVFKTAQRYRLVG